MKLEPGMYVNLKDVTEEQFNAMIEVAKVQGFTVGHVKQPNAVLRISDNGEMWTDLAPANADKEITIEDWLFSGAPDWAVDIVKSGDFYFYTVGYDSIANYTEKSSTLRGDDITHCCNFYYTGITVKTRTRKVQLSGEYGEFKPSVGDECIIADLSLYDSYKARLLFVGKDWVIWLRLDNDKEYCQHINKVKITPLPMHTKEELLAFEWYKEKFEGTDATIEECISGERNICNQFVVALDMIKAGYRKVTPLSYHELTSQLFDDRKDAYNWLVDNNHIIIKE